MSSQFKSIQWITKPPTLLAGWEGTDFVCSNRWQTRNNLSIIWISLEVSFLATVIIYSYINRLLTMVLLGISNGLLSKKVLNSDRKWIWKDKWPFYDNFWPFFCHLYDYLSQNRGSDNHFEVLDESKSYLAQKLWHKIQIFPFPALANSRKISNW